MVFYLKVNREERYTYRNLQHWIDTISYYTNPSIIIVCDKESIVNNIKSTIDFKNINYSIIESSISDEINYIVQNTCVENWHRAGIAHMTTFLHAKENRYDFFWNIDADDTLICLSAQRSYELLRTAEKYSFDSKLGLLSLDMWRTVVQRIHGTEHWTFGVTFTNANFDWMDYTKKYALDEGVKKLKLIKNLDCYFTYLSLKKEIKIETFYVENLKFIHYSDDFFKRLDCSGFFYWKNNKLIFPIIVYCIGAQKRGELVIADDVIKLDIKISDEESMIFLNEYAQDKLDLSRDLGE